MSSIIRTSDVAIVIGPLINKPLLTPREANILTFKLIELLMNSQCDLNCLKLLSRYLSYKSYDDLVMERNSNKLCGYPNCNYHSNDIKVIIPNSNSNTKISLKLSSFYKSSFCSKEHYQCSEFYKGQLSEEALFMRIDLNKKWFCENSIENSIKLLDDNLDNVLNGLGNVSIL